MGSRTLLNLQLGSRPFSSLARRTLYDILGVSPSSTRQEIKTQFYKLSLLYHPDRASLNDEDAANRTWRLEKFIQIKDAYEVLSHDVKRRAYDQQNGIQVVNQTIPMANRPIWDPYPGYRHTSSRFAYAKHTAATAEGKETIDPFAKQRSKWKKHSEADLQHIEVIRRSSAQEQQQAATIRRNRMAAILFIITFYYFIQHYGYSNNGKI